MSSNSDQPDLPLPLPPGSGPLRERAAEPPYRAKGYKLLSHGDEIMRFDFAEVAEIFARHMNAAAIEAEQFRAAARKAWESDQ